MKTTQHTPLRWTADGYDGCAIRHIRRGIAGEVIAEMRSGDTGIEERDANARFIVTACNAHNELLEALNLAAVTIKRMAKTDLMRLSPDNTLSIIEAAIQKGTNEAQGN